MIGVDHSVVLLFGTCLLLLCFEYVMVTSMTTVERLSMFLNHLNCGKCNGYVLDVSSAIALIDDTIS